MDRYEALFVLATHISHQFSAATLMLTLFSIRRFHPTARVYVIDNNSTGLRLRETEVPVRNRAFKQWYRAKVRTLSTPVEGPRDLGAFATMLQHLQTLLAGIAFV